MYETPQFSTRVVLRHAEKKERKEHLAEWFLIFSSEIYWGNFHSLRLDIRPYMYKSTAWKKVSKYLRGTGVLYLLTIGHIKDKVPYVSTSEIPTSWRSLSINTQAMRSARIAMKTMFNMNNLDLSGTNYHSSLHDSTLPMLPPLPPFRHLGLHWRRLQCVFFKHVAPLLIALDNLLPFVGVIKEIPLKLRQVCRIHQVIHPHTHMGGFGSRMLGAHTRKTLRNGNCGSCSCFTHCASFRSYVAPKVFLFCLRKLARMYVALVVTEQSNSVAHFPGVSFDSVSLVGVFVLDKKSKVVGGWWWMTGPTSSHKQRAKWLATYRRSQTKKNIQALIFVFWTDGKVMKGGIVWRH